MSQWTEPGFDSGSEPRDFFFFQTKPISPEASLVSLWSASCWRGLAVEVLVGTVAGIFWIGAVWPVHVRSKLWPGMVRGD